MAATGYFPWTVTAGEQPTTAYWNILGGNDASFNDGNGFNDGILLARHFSAGSVTTPAMKPTFAYYDGSTLNSGSTTRTVFTGGTSGVPAGCSVSYTTGSTNEVLYIQVSGLLSTAVANTVCGIAVEVNGAWVGHRTYFENSFIGQWLTHQMTHYFLASANTSYTIGMWVFADGASTTICNATTDHPNGYDPQLMIMSWGR